jgi:hypothetical protein
LARCARRKWGTPMSTTPANTTPATTTSLPSQSNLIVDDELKRVAYWILIWVGLANIAFASMWFVGAPPRQLEILVIGLTGLVARRFPFWLRFTCFTAIVIWSVLTFIGGLFNLKIPQLLYSIQFFIEIKPSNSYHYIAAAAVVVLILLLAWRLLKRDTNFSKSSMILAAGAAIFATTATDAYVGREMHGHYLRSATDGVPFGSATSRSGFKDRADGKRHLMLIVMESLGVPEKDAEMQRLLFTHYRNSAAVNQRYDLIRGTTPYYSSTTAGEMRELCGRWSDYHDLLTKKDDGCLPAMLAKKGYATRAAHSFIGKFFDRTTWYPNIGFDTMQFSQELRAKGANFCGGVFPGVCDRDVPKILAQELKQAKRPTFTYWLTLNSHLPIPQIDELNVKNCERISPRLKEDFPQICRQFAIWNDLELAMVKEITASDFPETDILIVGDHMPPFFDRHHRTQFDPKNVPWLYLRSKPSAAAH